MFGLLWSSLEPMQQKGPKEMMDEEDDEFVRMSNLQPIECMLPKVTMILVRQLKTLPGIWWFICFGFVKFFPFFSLLIVNFRWHPVGVTKALGTPVEDNGVNWETYILSTKPHQA